MDLDGIRALYSTGRFLATLREADHALDSAPPAGRPELLWLAGKSAWQLGLWQEARTYLSELADSQDATFLMKSKAAVALAKVLVELAEPGEAEQRLLSVLSSTHPEMDPGVKAQALYNLAKTYESQRQYGAALAAFRQAADSFLVVERPLNALSALQNAAWLALSEAREEANDLLQRAASMIEGGSPSHQVHQVSLEALAALLEGRYGEAMDMAEEALQPGHLHATAWDKALAASVISKAAEARGLAQIAVACASTARHFAQQSGDIRLIKMAGTCARDTGD